MNILIFTESYFPVINGVGVSTRILYHGLVRRGHTVTIAAPCNKKDYDGNERIIRTPSFNLSIAPDYPIPNLLRADAVAKAINDIQPDCVLAQIPFTYAAAARRICRRNNIPFAAFCHTLYTEYVHYCPFIPHGLSAGLLKKYMAYFYNGCDAAAVPSEMMRRELHSFGVTRNIDVIPTGIELPGAMHSRRAELGIGPEETVLVYMSRVAKEKNLDLLINAYGIVRDRMPDVRLLVVGGGPYLEHMKSRAGVFGSSVIFTGMIDKKQVYDYLSCGTIFVFPSITETQGLAVCEAQAAGLPVAAVRAGGVPENILEGRTGLLSENSAEDFAGIIIRLAEDRDMQKQMAAAAREYSYNFSIDRMIDKYERFFGELINKKGY